MKYLIALIIPFLLSFQHAKAQAWDKETKVISLGLGAANYYHVGRTTVGPFVTSRAFYSPVTGQLNVEGEFGVHEYVGVGFHTGLGGAAGIYVGNSGSFNFPIGFLANFHFYQLIEDKTGKNLHADVLDVFVGANVGTGVGAVFYNNSSTTVLPLAYGGLHAGARWYFAENIGLTGQFGFGKSLVDIGIIFKLN